MASLTNTTCALLALLSPGGIEKTAMDLEVRWARYAAVDPASRESRTSLDLAKTARHRFARTVLTERSLWRREYEGPEFRDAVWDAHRLHTPRPELR